MNLTRFVTGPLFVLFLVASACTSSRGVNEEAAAPKSFEEELIEKNLAAKGGLEKLKEVQSYVYTGKFETMGMEMPLILYQKRPHKVRSEVEVPGMGEVINSYDGEVAWTLNPMISSAPQKLTEEQTKITAERAELDGVLTNYLEEGFTAEYLGEEEVRGQMTHKLRVLRPGKSEVIVYLDKNTFLEIKLEGQGVDVQTGSVTKSTTYLGDYRDVEGMMIPFSMEMNTGSMYSDITYEEVKVNAPVEDTIFSFPSGSN